MKLYVMQTKTAYTDRQYRVFHRRMLFPTGRDLKPGREGGTWLGMNKDGRFEAITNYRQSPQFMDRDAIGKGHLVSDFLEGDAGDVRDYLENVSSRGDNYNGFNLLVGKLSLTGDSNVGWYCNVEDKVVRMLTPGFHALSNKVLNCSWPKMVYGRERFAGILNETCSKQELIDNLIGLLSRRDRLVNSNVNSYSVDNQ